MKKEFVDLLIKEFDRVKMNLDPYNWEMLFNIGELKVKTYKDPVYSFKVRNKEIKIETHTESLSHLQIPKVSLPQVSRPGEIYLNGTTEKMYRANFRILLVYILLKDKAKTQQECLRVKVDQSVPTDVFIM